MDLRKNSPASAPSSSSPLGDLGSSTTRKLLINLISTMNASFPDYDFRWVSCGLPGPEGRRRIGQHGTQRTWRRPLLQCRHVWHRQIDSVGLVVVLTTLHTSAWRVVGAA